MFVFALRPRIIKSSLYQDGNKVAMQEVSLPSATVVRIPVDPQARLRAALRMLETRLDQQRASIVAWRENMAELSDVIRDLRDNAEACRRNLDELTSRVMNVHQVTGELDHDLDRVLDAAGVRDS